MKIWLDDTRQKPGESWIHVHDARGAIFALDTCWLFRYLGYQVYMEISLDHDLGEGQTGEDVLKYIEEKVMVHNKHLPAIRIHTANPVARERMTKIVERLEAHVAQSRTTT